MGDVLFFMLLNLAHAAVAVAFPTLRLWAEYGARRKRPR
jgi:hypothetical protein